MTTSCEATLADSIRVVYFVEDRAQEGFIRAMVDRVASQESFPPGSLEHDVRSSGGSRVLLEFRDFVRAIRQQPQSLPHILVVAVDGNCKGYSQRVAQLGKYVRPTDPFSGRVVYAVPDPHIERWYLLDQRAFREGVGGEPPALPDYKCKKDYYKGLLAQALRNSGSSSLMGGAEFGERIAEHIDLTMITQRNAAFASFLRDLRNLFRKLRLQA